MKTIAKISLKNQSYVTPQTESVAVRNEGLLCGSAVAMGASGALQSFGKSSGTGTWGN